MKRIPSLLSFLAISWGDTDSADSRIKKFAKALGKGSKALGQGLGAAARDLGRGVRSTHQSTTGKGPDYSTGYGRARGKERYEKQRVNNPFGTAFVVLLIYLSVSVWPFPIFPFVNFWIILALFLAVWAWGAGSTWVFWFLAIFVLVTPFFGLSGFTQDLLSGGKIKADELRETIGLTNPIEGLKAKFYKTYGWTNPDIVEQEPQKGIQILSFATTEAFKEGKPVRLDAKVQIDGFYDPELGQYERQVVTFSCYQEDRNGKRIPGGDGEIYIKDTKKSDLPVPAQSQSTHYVSCRFPNGMKIEQTETPVAGSLFGVEEGTVIGNRIVTKKRVVLEARTRMLQVAGLKLWTVVDALAPEDITKVVNDPTLESDGRSKPQCRRGCGSPYFMRLTTGVMPMTEAKSPVLDVTFFKNEQRLGTIERLHRLSIHFPDELGVELVESSEVTGVSCDFTGDSSNAVLSSERLKAANEQLAQALKQAETSSAEQLSLPLEFSCGYQVTQPLERLGAQDITARADYDVVIRKRGLVDIYKEKPAEKTVTQGITG